MAKFLALVVNCLRVIFKKLGADVKILGQEAKVLGREAKILGKTCCSMVFKTILGDYNEWLAKKIFDFELIRENAIKRLEKATKSTNDSTF